MARPIYTHELADPDFSWLISNFRESNPQYSLIEVTTLPVVFIEDSSLVAAGTAVSVPHPDATAETPPGTKRP